MRKTLKNLAVVAALTFACLVPSCTTMTPAQRDHTRVQLESLRADLIAARAAAEADPDNQSLAETLRRIETALAVMQSAVDAETNAEGLSTMLDAAADFVPPKYSLILSIVSSAIAVLFGNRAAATRETARRVIGALEQVKEDGSVNFKANASKLSTLMGAPGKRLVDEAQGNKAALPL